MFVKLNFELFAKQNYRPEHEVLASANLTCLWKVLLGMHVSESEENV